jgi:hypothetical protein
MAYHYDPRQAFEDLGEEAVLPNPVHVRDMILRARLNPEEALELNRLFRDYQIHFGNSLTLARDLLGRLVRAELKSVSGGS